MGQSQKVRAFKNELRNYTYYLNRIVTLDNSIEFCYDRLSNVTGIDPSKEPIHGAPNKEYEWKLRDDIEKFEHLKKLTQEKIKYIDDVLTKMDTEIKWAIICVYIDGKQIINICGNIGLSPNGLQKRMNKAIEEAVD